MAAFSPAIREVATEGGGASRRFLASSAMLAARFPARQAEPDRSDGAGGLS